MDNRDSITEINMYGETVINCPPSDWSEHSMVMTALVDNAVMIVKNYQGVVSSTVHFKKNSKIRFVKEGQNSRVVWNVEDVISSTL